MPYIFDDMAWLPHDTVERTHNVDKSIQDSNKQDVVITNDQLLHALSSNQNEVLSTELDYKDIAKPVVIDDKLNESLKIAKPVVLYGLSNDSRWFAEPVIEVNDDDCCLLTNGLSHDSSLNAQPVLLRDGLSKNHDLDAVVLSNEQIDDRCLLEETTSQTSMDILSAKYFDIDIGHVVSDVLPFEIEKSTLKYLVEVNITAEDINTGIVIHDVEAGTAAECFEAATLWPGHNLLMKSVDVSSDTESEGTIILDDINDRY